MRRVLAVGLVALAFAGAAEARVPIPEARSFFVVNASNGEGLAARHAHARVPIASITKLMTVIVAPRHLKPSGVVTVRPQAPAVGHARLPLFAGERITVRDLLEGA